MKVLSFNIRHGGGSRVERIQRAIASHAPDLVVLPEFRNNAAGKILREWLTSFGHHSQAAGTTAAPVQNSVLLASHAFRRLEFPELGDEARRCVAVQQGSLTVF